LSKIEQDFKRLRLVLNFKSLNIGFCTLFQRAKTFGGCFEFKVLKAELDPQRAGELIIPPGPQFRITKHLNLAVLAQGANFFVGVLNLRF
jgi:hypothetical protein